MSSGGFQIPSAVMMTPNHGNMVNPLRFDTPSLQPSEAELSAIDKVMAKQDEEDRDFNPTTPSKRKSDGKKLKDIHNKRRSTVVQESDGAQTPDKEIDVAKRKPFMDKLELRWGKDYTLWPTYSTSAILPRDSSINEATAPKRESPENWGISVLTEVSCLSALVEPAKFDLCRRRLEEEVQKRTGPGSSSRTERFIIADIRIVVDMFRAENPNKRKKRISVKRKPLSSNLHLDDRSHAGEDDDDEIVYLSTSPAPSDRRDTTILPRASCDLPERKRIRSQSRTPVRFEVEEATAANGCHAPWQLSAIENIQVSKRKANEDINAMMEQREKLAHELATTVERIEKLDRDVENGKRSIDAMEAFESQLLCAHEYNV